jgi:hypothetical protein
VSAQDIWISIRDYSLDHAAIFLAILAIALGGGLLVYRPALGELTASRLQSVSILIAIALVGYALSAHYVTSDSGDYVTLDSTDDASLLQRVPLLQGFSVSHARFASVLLILGLVVLVGAYLAQRFGDEWIVDFRALSMSRLRDLAVVAGILLLVAAALYSTARYLVEGTFSKEYTLIAPFTIAGSEDKQQRGLALATALQAKLVDIERDVHSLNDILRSERAEREAEAGLSTDPGEASALNVYRRIDLELKFQGVDVGGLFARVSDWFASRRALQITVAEQDGRAIVSGALRPDGRSHVYAEIDKATNERIVAAVAYSKLRERLIAEQSGYESLKWDDVEALHNTVVAVTDLRGRSEVKMEQFKPHLQKIAELIAKAPRLERLLMLGAEVATKAGEIDTAMAFLDRAGSSLSDLRDRLDRARPDPQQAEADDDQDQVQEFLELRTQFVRRFNALLLQRQRTLSNCALPLVERLRAGEEPKTVFAQVLAAHEDLLRIMPAGTSYTPTIAIIGGVPQRERVGYAFETKGEWLIGRAGYDNFSDTLGLIVATLAPNAKLLFIPLGVKSFARGSNLTPSEAEIEQAVRTAVEAGADIAVVPFSFRLKRRMSWINDIEAKVLLVSPAPSKLFQEQYKIDITQSSAAFIGDVDVDGRFKLGILSTKEVLVSYPGALWAPGTRIPRLGADGLWQATYGAGYASAAAAAVFANLLGARGKTAPGDLLDLVRKTLRHVDTREPAIGIIDQAAALASAGAAPPELKTSCGP